LLLSPEVPLVFMGQEWAAPEPFLFFTDHHEELGRMVTEGRRKEFSHFSAFSDVGNHASIPDPQKLETFQKSKLDWKLREDSEHEKCLDWYKALLHMRKELLHRATFKTARALNAEAIEVVWETARGSFRAVVALEGPTVVSDPLFARMKVMRSSEDDRYAEDPHPIGLEVMTGTLSFERAGAILLTDGDRAALAEERTQ
jgi:maltooligosyltrehalose trehalohydrolase